MRKSRQDSRNMRQHLNRLSEAVQRIEGILNESCTDKHGPAEEKVIDFHKKSSDQASKVAQDLNPLMASKPKRQYSLQGFKHSRSLSTHSKEEEQTAVSRKNTKQSASKISQYESPYHRLESTQKVRKHAQSRHAELSRNICKTCPDESTLSFATSNPEGLHQTRQLPEQAQHLLPLFLETTQQYGFVQHYLSKVELWQTYQRIAAEGIPRSRWAVMLMQAAYQKMQ